MRAILLLIACFALPACNLSTSNMQAPTRETGNQAIQTSAPANATADPSAPTADPAQMTVVPLPTSAGEADATGSEAEDTAGATPTFDFTGLSQGDVRNTYPVVANAGQVILVDYSVTLNSSGQVYIYVNGPDQNTIGGVNIRETRTDTLAVTAHVSASYTIQVAFRSLPGTYTLSFRVE